MTVATQTIRCPYCKELINAKATVCKHCHSDLSSFKKTKKSFLSKYNTFRTGFLSGTLFCLILLVLWLVYVYSAS